MEQFKERQKNYSSSYIRNIKNILHNAFNSAVKQGIILINPLNSVKLSTKAYNDERSQTKRTLSQEEIKILLECSKGTRYYLPILISLQMGLRRGEVLGLTWDSINFNSNTMTIDKILTSTKAEGLVLTTPKTKMSNRTIKMTNLLVEELLKHRHKQNELKQHYGDYYYSEHEFVCCKDDGTPIAPNENFNSTFRHFIKKHVPFNCRFHDLRHTHATLLLEAGINPKVIQERLGHTNITTTLNIYSHVTKNMEEDSLLQFEKTFNT